MSESLMLSLELVESISAGKLPDRLRLEVCFKWEANRFRHNVRLCNSQGQVLEIWRDEADGRDSDWPTSAPIQQLSREEIGGQMTLLGVGQAGLSHWSVCIEPTQRNQMPGFRFDYACRVKQPPQWLGSTYKIEPPKDPSDVGTPRMTLHLDDSTEFRVTQSHDQRKVALASDPHLLKAGSMTYRWAYVIHPSPLL